MMIPSLAQASRRWVPRHGSEPSAAAAAELAAGLSLPESIGRLLLLRGLSEPAPAKVFLRPRLQQLHPPSALTDVDRAVERLTRAIHAGETILVHGDYDVDGMCAAALYTRVLRRLGARVVAFVPHRLRDGYDLGSGGLRAAAQAGARLILTADCGIVAADAVAQAAGAQVDVIVTDHHTPGAVLPGAYAVVNPKRADCEYPEKGLCGAGVAFKVCQALVAALGGSEDDLLYELDLVALATVADLVPLDRENRVLVRYGLRVMNESRNAGIRALLAVVGLANRGGISAAQVGHVLAPRLNAAGRIGEADWALRLLLSEADAEARELAERLERTNQERRQVDRETLQQAVGLLEREYDPSRDFGVVLAAAGWHPGVIGIVASRVVELVHRPAVLIALRDGARARGSARSIRGFDLYGAIHACGGMLERYGGHRQAAGLEIKPDRVVEFREAFNHHAAESLRGRDLAPELEYDLELPLAEATRDLVRLLAHFGPFGIANPTPVFVARAANVYGLPRTVGAGGEHLKLELNQNGARLRAIGFGLADRLRDPALAQRPIDIAFTLQEDRWNGRARLQARLLDIKASSP